jgi:hypothetical protein
MTFKALRDKAQWIALAGALVIFFGQWWAQDHYVNRIRWVDHTPPVLNLIGFVLTVFTFGLGLLTLPRWQSFLALLASLWVTLIFIQGI